MQKSVQLTDAIELLFIVCFSLFADSMGIESLSGRLRDSIIALALLGTTLVRNGDALAVNTRLICTAELFVAVLFIACICALVCATINGFACDATVRGITTFGVTVWLLFKMRVVGIGDDVLGVFGVLGVEIMSLFVFVLRELRIFGFATDVGGFV